MGVKLLKSGVIQVGYKAFKVDAKGTDKYRLSKLITKLKSAHNIKLGICWNI